MGYSHYIRSMRATTPEEWAALGNAVLTILVQSKVSLGDAWGEGLPEFDADVITFNGRHEDAYETVRIWREGASGESIKTGRRKYDLVVTAVLAYLASYWGAEIGSDGSEQDWAPGVALAIAAGFDKTTNPMAAQP